jgi:hypothetical protein
LISISYAAARAGASTLDYLREAPAYGGLAEEDDETGEDEEEDQKPEPQPQPARYRHDSLGFLVLRPQTPGPEARGSSTRPTFQLRRNNVMPLSSTS